MSQHNDHSATNSDDDDGSWYVPTTMEATQLSNANGGDGGANDSQSNGQASGDDPDATKPDEKVTLDAVEAARADMMVQQRELMIGYLDAHGVLNNSSSDLREGDKQEKEIPDSNDAATTEKELEMASTVVPSTQSVGLGRDHAPEKEKELRYVMEASQAAGSLMETGLRPLGQNAMSIFKDGNTRGHQPNSTSELQQVRIGPLEKELDGAAAHTQAGPGYTSVNVHNMSTAATATNHSSTTILPGMRPTELSRAQPRTNQPVTRPGAIRVVQREGGAYMERPDLIRDVTTIGYAASAASQIPHLDVASPSEISGAIAATLVQDSFRDTNGATVAEIEEARRMGEEEARRNVLKDAVLADVAEGDGKSRNIKYLVGMLVCVIVVGGAVVGVVVSFVSGGGSSSTLPSASVNNVITTTPTLAPVTTQPTESSAHPSATPTGSPSSSPSMNPAALKSARPTTSDDIAISQKIDRVIRTVSDASLLDDIHSFQHEGLRWMLDEDQWVTLETEEQLIKERYVVFLFVQILGWFNWSNRYNFKDPTVSVCEWGKVLNPISNIPTLSCNDAKRVRSISLVQNGLLGAIPSEFAILDSLDTLHLQGNRISGPLPSELGQLSGLKVLRMESNWLSQRLPTEFGNLQALTELDLSENLGLDGPIPTQMNAILTLDVLLIDGTGLTNVETMCETGIDWILFQSDCVSDALTCTCCTHCCLDGTDCAPNNRQTEAPSELLLL